MSPPPVRGCFGQVNGNIQVYGGRNADGGGDPCVAGEPALSGGADPRQDPCGPALRDRHRDPGRATPCGDGSPHPLATLAGRHPPRSQYAVRPAGLADAPVDRRARLRAALADPAREHRTLGDDWAITAYGVAADSRGATRGEHGAGRAPRVLPDDGPADRGADHPAGAGGRVAGCGSMEALLRHLAKDFLKRSGVAGTPEGVLEELAQSLAHPQRAVWLVLAEPSTGCSGLRWRSCARASGRPLRCLRRDLSLGWEIGAITPSAPYVARCVSGPRAGDAGLGSRVRGYARHVSDEADRISRMGARRREAGRHAVCDSS